MTDFQRDLQKHIERLYNVFDAQDANVDGDEDLSPILDGIKELRRQLTKARAQEARMRPQFEAERQAYMDKLDEILEGKLKCVSCHAHGIPVTVMAFECGCRPSLCLECARATLGLTRQGRARCVICRTTKKSEGFCRRRSEESALTVDQGIIDVADRKLRSWLSAFNMAHKTNFEDVVPCECGEWFPSFRRLLVHKRSDLCPH